MASIEYWKSKYEKLDQSKWQEVIDNPENYQPEVIAACKDLLYSEDGEVTNLVNPTIEDERLEQDFERLDTEPETVSRVYRFAHFCIDQFAILGLSGFALPVTQEIYAMTSISMTTYTLGFMGLQFSYEIFSRLVLGGVYFFCFERFFGKTLGKLLLKTTVVSKSEVQLTNSTVIVRTLSRLIPLESLSFLLSKDSGLHDRLSGTMVLKDEDVNRYLEHRRQAVNHLVIDN